MDKGEIPKNCSLKTVLIKRRTIQGFPALQQVAGTPLISLFPAIAKDRIKTASVVPGNEITEELPGPVIFR
jgi:hypothetical protein